MEHGIINTQMATFSQIFIVPTDVGDVYLVSVPEEDPNNENNNMNIVPQSSSVESLEFLSGGPLHAAGGASLMSSHLILTPPWYTATSAHPSTDYNSVFYQKAGQMSSSNTPSSSVLNMSVSYWWYNRKKRKAASNSMALFKNTLNKLGPKGSSTQTSSTCSNNWQCPSLRSSSVLAS